MTINLTPEIQMEIYKDKQKEYTLEMLDKISKQYEYEPKDDEEESWEKDDKKDKPWINDSSYGSSSYFQQKNLNSNFSTEGFFNTLSSNGNVSNSGFGTGSNNS